MFIAADGPGREVRPGSWSGCTLRSWEREVWLCLPGLACMSLLVHDKTLFVCTHVVSYFSVSAFGISIYNVRIME